MVETQTHLLTYLLTLLTYLLTHSLTPWSRVLLEKLTIPQLVNKFPSFMEPEGSLPQTQEPATRPCPESHQSSPSLSIQLPEDPS